MRPLLLALPVLVACASAPTWTAPDEGSLCTLDLGGRSIDHGIVVDLVLVVDDSPSA